MGMSERLYIESFQKNLMIEYNDFGLHDCVLKACPPGSRVVRAHPPDGVFSLSKEAGCFRVSASGRRSVSCSTLGEAAEELRGFMEFFLACESESLTFIHAGAVVLSGVGVLLPGRTYAGKSTLVRSLVESGATYYSDEFAVLDESGLLHPYPRRVKLRVPMTGAVDSVDVEASLGAKVGCAAVKPGLILSLRYDPDVVWDVSLMTEAEAATELLVNCARARFAPGQVLNSTAKATRGTIALRGRRGDSALVLDAIQNLVATHYG